MKTLEFQATISADRTLAVPPEIARQVDRERPVRVVLVLEDDKDERLWKDSASQAFLDGYDQDDAIYDKLPSR